MSNELSTLTEYSYPVALFCTLISPQYNVGATSQPNTQLLGELEINGIA